MYACPVGREPQDDTFPDSGFTEAGDNFQVTHHGKAANEPEGAGSEVFIHT